MDCSPTYIASGGGSGPKPRHQPVRPGIREVVNGLMYILETSCPWRHLPKDFPPKSTVHGNFGLWSWDGTLEHLHDTLYVALREHEGREASPTAEVIDSQSAKSAAKGGPRLIRSAMTRARRPKASSAYPDRSSRAPVKRRGSPGKRTGSRWRGPSAEQTGAPPVPIHRGHLRRCRIPGAKGSRHGSQVRRMAD